MGKRLKSQKRGKGSPTYRVPSHRYISTAEYRTIQKTMKAEVIDFVKDPSKTAVMALLRYEDGKESYIIAPEGMMAGTYIEHGPEAKLERGNIIPLKAVPEGYPIYNIEVKVGDGGKLVRASGNCAYVVSKEKDYIYIKLPSRKVKKLNKNCYATLGCAANGGRTEKPLLKAGNAFHKHCVKANRWPIVRGVKMSAVYHPFGGKQHHGAMTPKGKGGAPGQHVGSFGSSRTGRRKR